MHQVCQSRIPHHVPLLLSCACLRLILGVVMVLNVLSVVYNFQ